MMVFDSRTFDHMLDHYFIANDGYGKTNQVSQKCRTLTSVFTTTTPPVSFRSPIPVLIFVVNFVMMSATQYFVNPLANDLAHRRHTSCHCR